MRHSVIIYTTYTFNIVISDNLLFFELLYFFRFLFIFVFTNKQFKLIFLCLYIYIQR